MRIASALLCIAAMAVIASAQNYSQRGFIENDGTFYPQRAVNDQTRFVGESLLRYESFYNASKSWQFAAGVDLQIDTHHQVERSWDLSWSDREIRRPTAEAHRLTGTYHRDKLTLEFGKQLVRWGKTDILNPTDRFAPQDFLTVVNSDFIPITAARATYEDGPNTIDVVWSPRLTPSRIPLLNQRWFVPPPALPPNVSVQDGGADFPKGSQEGIRWNHLGRVEFALDYYQGFNHLPSFATQTVINSAPRPIPSYSLYLNRFYPEMRMTGADAAVPMRWLTLKTEGGYFLSTDPRSDEYALYVVQLERTSGEWFFVGGYAGQVITRHGTESEFAPDRGLTRTLLGRATYTIDANRNLLFEGAVRETGLGAYVKAEYSEGLGQHWRATLNSILIRGDLADFLGKYRRNSDLGLILRYSF
jgi:hypothetical protein